MAKPIGSLVLALTIAVPPQAGAECAWVLWERQEHRGVVTFQEPGGKVTRSVMYVLTCFPDTIDPRGVKSR